MPRNGKPDEAGATIPLIALILVALLTCAAFAIDLGSLAATNRHLQAIADLASLDAGREINGLRCDSIYRLGSESSATTLWDHVRTAALTSARRNGFEPGGDRTLSVALGVMTAGTFTPMMDETTPLCSTTPNAVQVLAADRTAYHFAPVIGIGGQGSGRQAIAGPAWECAPTGCGGSSNPLGEGAFVLGSALATISSSQSTVYNLLVRPLLKTSLCRGSGGGCNADIDAVGYGNLAGARLRLGDLAAQMGAGTTENVFAAPSVTVGQFLTASAAVLNGQGTSSGQLAAAKLLALSAQITTVTSLRISDFVHASTGTGSAADAMVDALTLVRVAAAIANGNNAISVPAVNLSVPGVSTIGLQLSAIQKPIVVVGPVGTSATITQAPITITVNLNVQVSPTVRVTGALPITTAAGSGTGTLTAADCLVNRGITVSGQAQAVNLTSSGTLQVVTAIPIANLGVNGTGVATADPPTPLRFNYPAGYNITQRTGNTELGLNNIAYGNPTVTLLGILPLPLPLATIMNSVKSTLGVVDTLVVKPLFESLGLNVGSASVMAIEPAPCSPN